MLWPNGSTIRPHVSSSFGPRSAPVAGASRVHRGTDFTNYSSVRSIAPGRVVVVGSPGGWGGGGSQVWVQHDGFFTRSMHLRAGSTQVRVGQWVDAGQVLGVMGMTGTASGVHHHLEITPGNVHYSNTGQVDPVPFISNRLSAPAGGGGTPIAPRVPKEDDDMLMINLHGIGTATHKVALGPGIFRHFIGTDPYEKIKNLARIQDDWQDVSYNELPALLRTYGCDLNIWDWNPSAGGFCILDPLTGTVKPGNVWTASGATRAAIAGIKLPALDPAPIVAAVKAALASGVQLDEKAFVKRSSS